MPPGEPADRGERTREPRLRLGISACLLGQHVRWDGGEKRAPLLSDLVAPRVQWLPVCPEVEMGLGTPRPPIVLRREGRRVRMHVPQTDADPTPALRAWSPPRLAALADEGIAGYVLKSRSPSCGLRDVPVLDAAGAEVARGSGLFAAALEQALPLLPLAEETELEDPAALAQFLRRAFFYRRWLARLGGDEPAPLADFHRRHRSLLLASGTAATRRLDRALADGEETPELAERYARAALRILRLVPTRRSHARNLGWVVGHLVVHVGDRERRQNVEAYRAFARGEMAWSAAACVLRRSAEGVAHAAVLESAYLFPEPAEWELMVQLDRLQTVERAPVN